MNERAVIDIPDIRTLEYSTAAAEVEAFKRTWGIHPTSVALPMLLPYGIPFDNPFTSPEGVRYGGRTSDMYLGGVAREFANLGLNIVLTVNPSMSFAMSPNLHVVDIRGSGSAQVCPAKSSVQRLLRELVVSALDILEQACKDGQSPAASPPYVEGVALDVENFWPLGARRERVELTCFCRECREQLSSYTKLGTQLIKDFERFPNPWNLLLRDSGTGVEPINDVEWDMVPKSLVDKSHLNGFDQILVGEHRNLEEDAEVLIEYMQARHRQVAGIIQSFFAMLPDRHGKPYRKILILEQQEFNWTEGLFLKKLDDPAICDELWFDPSELSWNTQAITNCVYMHRRCRYFIDAFFHALYVSEDEGARTNIGLARLDDDELKAMLDLRPVVPS